MSRHSARSDPGILPPELEVRELAQAEAEALAGALFRRAFGHPLPDFPRHFGLFAAPSPALLAYLHLLPFENAYLGGGFCANLRALRRLPPALQEALKRAHGPGYAILAGAIGLVGDCAAVFGYQGAGVDPRARWVIDRLGAEPTPHPYLFVLWRNCRDPREQAALIERVAALGPF